MRRLLSLLLACLPPAAHGQIVSLYATFSPNHLSGLSTGSTNAGPTTTSYWTPGVGSGVTLNVLPVGPVRLGVDLRGSASGGTNSADLILAGPRLTLKLPVVGLKPYAEAAGGYLRTHTTLVNSPFAGSTFTNSFAAYEILGGIDAPLLPFLDLRVIEIGGGQGRSITAAGTAAYTISLFTLNTGVVFHF